MFIAFIKNLPVGELPSHGHSASTNNVNQNGNIGWLQAGNCKYSLCRYIGIFEQITLCGYIDRRRQML